MALVKDVIGIITFFNCEERTGFHFTADLNRSNCCFDAISSRSDLSKFIVNPEISLKE